MPKLLLEYKGVPAVLNHRFKKIDNITFITVYTTGQNDYNRKDFEDLEQAIDFNPERAILKLMFVYLKSVNNGINYVIYQSVNFANNKLFISDVSELLHKGFKFTVDFGLESFRLKKIKLSVAATKTGGYEISYVRRKTIKTDIGKTYELLDSFYETFPRFEDIFLETLFMLDIMSTNYLVANKEELEAYFLQGKISIGKNRKVSIAKTNSQLADINEQSEQQIELSNLIGLNTIKLEIQELKSLAQFRKKRIEFKLPVTPSTLHLVFTGNPGTGKTTVARLLGQIYYDIGLLSSNKVVEVSRADLVGQYVGHTAPKTQRVFESALGGILFIDEAYSLFKTGSDFGNEAVETLLKLMEDNREKIVVIIAGYPKQIDELLSSNPGLKSRFSKTLHFPDYSKEELSQIFQKMSADYHNRLSKGAKHKIEFLIDKYYESGLFNSNARSVRNIFEETIKRQSFRVSQIENLTQDEITCFIDKDIPDKLQ
ncbi:AAA family ATPase [Segetibacter koreensis]|uniref:AAA family ATPase n=1 Tax=Segetibacter koreensis TaxID=398037 RepID=UPI00036D5D5D|nr:AAA family ATPase [Segetibacter koreensis]